MIDLFRWVFCLGRADAEAIVSVAISQQLHFERAILAFEKPDLKPYPLVIRYDKDQRILAVYQRALKAYAVLGRRPPKYLKEIVHADPL